MVILPPLPAYGRLEVPTDVCIGSNEPVLEGGSVRTGVLVGVRLRSLLWVAKYGVKWLGDIPAE